MKAMPLFILFVKLQSTSARGRINFEECVVIWKTIIVSVLQLEFSTVFQIWETYFDNEMNDRLNIDYIRYYKAHLPWQSIPIDNSFSKTAKNMSMTFDSFCLSYCHLHIRLSYKSSAFIEKIQNLLLFLYFFFLNFPGKSNLIDRGHSA